LGLVTELVHLCFFSAFSGSEQDSCSILLTTDSDPSGKPSDNPAVILFRLYAALTPNN